MPSRAVAEPLRFSRIFLEKVWGGRALDRTPGIDLPPDQPIGETWEISDRADHNSVVLDGPHRGRSLREIMSAHSDEVLGRARPASDGSFPLLIKFLDATQPLSVQVHPHGSTARRGGECKTECWYILAASPGSTIYLGLQPGVTREDLAEHASQPSILDLLVRHEVCAGQFVFVPGGTVHAVGAGITLLEVQNNADVTLRLYDWNRAGLDGRPRTIQAEDALGAVLYGEAVTGPVWPALVRGDDGNARAALLDCDEFEIELLEIERAAELDTRDVAQVYVALTGHGRLRDRGRVKAWAIAPGDTWLVPAAMGDHAIESNGALRILRARTKA
ncbi:MAG: type I phosphomannose isomerase catalytic subunit [Planctomycetota bacterium]